MFTFVKSKVIQINTCIFSNYAFLSFIHISKKKLAARTKNHCLTLYFYTIFYPFSNSLFKKTVVSYSNLFFLRKIGNVRTHKWISNHVNCSSNIYQSHAHIFVMISDSSLSNILCNYSSNYCFLCFQINIIHSGI